MRNKWQLSALKILGLASAVSASLLLIKYVSWQWTFDRFHEQAAHIVRIQNDHHDVEGRLSRSAKTYSGVAVVANDRFPAVHDYVRMGRWIANDVVFRFEEQMFRGRDVFFVDSSFFDVFSFELVRGDPQNALAEPNSVVLTEKVARQLFGDREAIGEEIIFENRRNFHVTGIVADPPKESHIQFDILASLSTFHSWGFQVYGDAQLRQPYVYSYLLLEPGTDVPELATQLTREISSLKVDIPGSDEFDLQPLTEIHLYSNLEQELSSTGQGNNIWILSGVALLILLLGWINHFNLFTASALQQSESLSIRKIIGAERKHLFAQIAIAGSIYGMLSLALAAVVVEVVQPLISANFDVPLAEVPLVNWQISNPAFILLILLVVGTGLSIWGPAILLSEIRPKHLLSRKLFFNPGGWHFRRVLVGFQFTIIICLLACTIVVFQQTRYMQRQDPGLAVDDVLVLRAPLGIGYENLRGSFPGFRDDVMSRGEVLQMSLSHSIPGEELELINKVEHNGKTYSFSFYRNYGSLDYFDSYDIAFLEKSDVLSAPAAAQGSDELRRSVINQKASQLLGFASPAEAIGQKIRRWEQDQVIVAVVDDYHQRSLHHAQAPIIYDIIANDLIEDGYYSFELNHPDERTLLLTHLQDAYQKAFPHTVFEPVDPQEQYAQQYAQDNHFAQLNMAFTVLGILIGVLGLLGLMIIVVEMRTREVSVRRILGATYWQIISTLSHQLVKAVIISFLIALPVGYYLMGKWLDNFSYHVAVDFGAFAISGMVALLLVLLTVAYHGIKVAKLNPADVLREE